MVAALVQSAATTTCWSATPDGKPGDSIGIKLLDAPTNRRDDPRAKTYIIDFLPPNSVIQRRVEVSNTTDETKSFDVYAAAADIRDAKFVFGNARTANELSSWVSFDRTHFDLPAHSTTTVLATITVPLHATGGEQYAVIWAEVAAPPGASGNIGMINRVGVRIYLDVGPGGEPKTDFEIESITPARTDDGRPEIRAQVHNTGGRAIDVSGTLSLSDGPGALSAGPFNLSVGTTIGPGGRAEVKVLLDKRLPVGPWKAELSLASGLITRTVNAVITFPSSPGVGETVTTQSPYPKLLLIGLAGLLAVACTALLWIGILAWRRRRREREEAKQW
ncbi:hypothetical protein Lesp02_23420 [Lentzea sp. NBRC 105346]|uniref:hypothetical protein n=1 Tax=Lentzea sp. NBRC 105346 TaxID=3032205 RepID=UPI00249FB83E|nr:hypothetical protein [Lentzea sp. NBRC 105346]GLZ30152.1 hypothetical protein Lesp02_23420 [Lentzea sp. NBRC 105346]